MEEPRIKIGFTLTDHFGNEYSATSNSRDCILMEDLTEEELDALLDYLDELRGSDKNGGEEND